MDNSREKLEKHLLEKKLYLVFSIIFLVAGLIGFGYIGLDKAGIINRINLNEVQIFNPEDANQEGKYVAIPVVGISEWAAQNGTDYYFIVRDIQGFVSIVKLGMGDYQLMVPQQNYWKERVDNGNKTAEVPDAHVLFGISKPSSSELLSTVASTYKVSAEEITKLVGIRYLSEGERPGVNLSQVMWAVAIGGTVIGILFLFAQRSFTKTLQRTLDRLQAEGKLHSALTELEGLKAEKGNKRLLFGPNYIYHFASIFSYEDIVWAYGEIRRRNFVEVGTSVIAKTKDGGHYVLLTSQDWGNKKREKMEGFLAFLREKNPNILFGYSAENKRLCSEKVNEYKNSILRNKGNF